MPQATLGVTFYGNTWQYVRNIGPNMTSKVTMHDFLRLFFTYKYKYFYHYDALEITMGLWSLDMVGVGKSFFLLKEASIHPRP